MKTSEALNEHKHGIMSEAVHELNKENKASDTVRNLHSKSQMQNSEISRQRCFYENSQRHQTLVVTDIRDQEEVHQEPMPLMRSVGDNASHVKLWLCHWVKQRCVRKSLRVRTPKEKLRITQLELAQQRVPSRPLHASNTRAARRSGKAQEYQGLLKS